MPQDPYSDVLAGVVDALIAGDERAALAAMDGIAFTPLERKTERWPAQSVIATAYARDRYQCRYCGERVILTPVLRLLSRLYPQQFPYHQNWKADSTHPAFILRSATIDHITPIAAGGDPVGIANLATACWTCNRRKGDLDLSELRWSLKSPADDSWRGLSNLFRPLWVAAGSPKLSEDELSWMRATERANLELDRPN
jgi:5-methylcytosine-specific restriction endonuclease McrA